MKKFFAIILLGSIALTSNGQKTINSGKLTYSINVEGKKPLDASLSSATFTVFFNPQQSRTDMVNAVGKESNIFDNRLGLGFILKEYSGQRLMITMTRNNWEEKNGYYRDINFTTDDAMVKVGDYDCKKAVANLKDGGQMTVYYAPAYLPSNKTYNNAFPQLPGLPVQFIIQKGELAFNYSLSGLSIENISSVSFEQPQSGYRVMTFEQTQQLKKAE